MLLLVSILLKYFVNEFCFYKTTDFAALQKKDFVNSRKPDFTLDKFEQLINEMFSESS